jgi:DNA-binding MarR family transcriptional regulator
MGRSVSARRTPKVVKLDLAAKQADEVRAANLQIHGMPGHLIRRLQQVAVAIFIEEMDKAGIDLTPVQFAALSAIQTYPRIDQATLGGVIAYDRTTIGGVIDRLEEKSLVRRAVDKENRRVRQLIIEPEGERLLTRVKPLVARIQKRIVAPLNGTERALYMRLITKLASAHNEQSRAPLRPVVARQSTGLESIRSAVRPDRRPAKADRRKRT